MSDEEILERFLAGESLGYIASQMEREAQDGASVYVSNALADGLRESEDLLHILAVIRTRLATLTAYKAGHKRAGRKRKWTDVKARNVEMVRRYRARKKLQKSAQSSPNTS